MFTLFVFSYIADAVLIKKKKKIILMPVDLRNCFV